MYKTAQVALPAAVEDRLKNSSEFFDNVMDFAREDLIGFKRPIAATFALLTPMVAALAFYTVGLVPFAEIMASYLTVAGAGIYLVGRREWPGLVDEFAERTHEKRRAIGDLKCGFGEMSVLKLARAPRFYEYDNGVLVFADAGDFKTLFFSIERDPTDLRWGLYLDGALTRRIWRWMRLPVSRELVKFETGAGRLPGAAPAKKINSIEVWEAINVAFGEPLDGALIHRPFDEIVEMTDAML